MHGSRTFCQTGSKFDVFVLKTFLVDEGREDPNTTISGPSSARQRNRVSAFRWYADDGPTVKAGFVAL